ncbi:hypothetical protein RHMOL_Rhmol04G0069600 [Rhododendron molle]|uniref:Uncharacterized protein n=1 Tax=Rhododendron molle TaxID=49168 RepID=A0ACC0NY71_RHOML|nr:hypothetical protein RHMOL_Rhmol04G0069600 [Rhododendron molle]
MDKGLGGLTMKGWKMRGVNNFCSQIYRVLKFGRYTGDCNKRKVDNNSGRQ